MKPTIEHLEFIVTHTDATIKHFNGKEDITTIPFFCLGLLERLHAASKGLKLLSLNIEDDYYLEYPAGLIIRTTLLDFLLVLKAYKIKETFLKDGKSVIDAEPSLTKYCNEIFADGVNHTIKYIENLESKSLITKNEAEHSYIDYSKRYNKFIGEYKGNNIKPETKFKNNYSPKNLFEELSDHPLLKSIAMNYDTYLLYSKYEHFSIMSYDVIRREIPQKSQKLHEAIELFALHNYIICDLIADYITHDFVLGQHKSAVLYIEKYIFNISPHTLRY